VGPRWREPVGDPSSTGVGSTLGWSFLFVDVGGYLVGPRWREPVGDPSSTGVGSTLGWSFLFVWLRGESLTPAGVK
jgi:hypothetical protein